MIVKCWSNIYWDRCDPLRKACAPIEFEIDPETLKRTGRWRRHQFGLTMRRARVPVSLRITERFR